MSKVSGARYATLTHLLGGQIDAVFHHRPEGVGGLAVGYHHEAPGERPALG